ncbi:hypothetical protein QBC40DRAFT_315603 [Triangularia verruculosa]|uniref:Secreted protein n=1 Tax=Triangularia verruculosa TaxID=2587418 RepID=A0AAN6X829_9PEZI|nr:hypothetical protein QBC40DRAFT_315603 [Triangularia verruculosa]
MMLTSLVSGMLLAAVSVHAIPASFDGMTISDITWTGQVVENGPMVNFSGPSLYAIEQSIAAVYPGFTWASAPRSIDQDAATADLHSSDDSTDIPTPSLLKCWEGGAGDADSVHINEGVNYLQSVPGWCNNGPGPNNCGQISCSYNSAIMWCNHNPYPYKTLCQDFAKYARAVMTGCHYTTRESAHYNVWTRGTQNDELGFSVIAAKPNQDC